MLCLIFLRFAFSWAEGLGAGMSAVTIDAVAFLWTVLWGAGGCMVG